MKIRNQFACAPGMSATERKMGRLMRDPNGHPAGGDDTGNQGGAPANEGVQSQNNGQGNAQGFENQTGTQDNNGQELDPNAFWNDPNAAGDGNSSHEEDLSGQHTGQQIVQDIQNFRIEPLFSAETAQQISEGNFENVNTALNTAMQNTMRQTVALTARIMQDFEKSIQSQIQGSIKQNQTQQTDEQMLSENFSTYTNPAMKPMIRGVFNQALKHSGNDRDKAMRLTRSMLQTMGQTGSSDLGFQTPPAGPDDYQSEGPSSLVKDLLAMR